MNVRRSNSSLEFFEMSLPPLAELTKPARQNPSWSLVANRFENEIHFEADEWKGTQWQHSLVVSFPQNNEAESTWVLHITGGEPNDFDLKWSQSLADLSHCPVATLFHIPNQPLWELWEDDLIAQTCVRSLDASDLSWPLLIPMVRSVRTAMSLLQKVAPELWPEFESPKNFIPFSFKINSLLIVSSFVSSDSSISKPCYLYRERNTNNRF